MRLLQADGVIHQIDPGTVSAGPVLTQLMSDEILYSEEHGPRNEFASFLAKRPIYGDAILCDAEQEVDLCR